MRKSVLLVVMTALTSMLLLLCSGKSDALKIEVKSKQHFISLLESRKDFVLSNINSCSFNRDSVAEVFKNDSIYKLLSNDINILLLTVMNKRAKGETCLEPVRVKDIYNNNPVKEHIRDAPAHNIMSYSEDLYFAKGLESFWVHVSMNEFDQEFEYDGKKYKGEIELLIGSDIIVYAQMNGLW